MLIRAIAKALDNDQTDENPKAENQLSSETKAGADFLHVVEAFIRGRGYLPQGVQLVIAIHAQKICIDMRVYLVAIIN